MEKIYFFFFLFFSITTYSQNDNTHLNLNKKNIAVDGYDLVAYFKLNDSKTGKKEFKYTYREAHYFFLQKSTCKALKLTLKSTFQNLAVGVLSVWLKMGKKNE